MQKLKRQMYITKKGGSKVNCYYVNISKELIHATDITEDDELEIRAKGNKIIIQKASNEKKASENQ